MMRLSNSVRLMLLLQSKLDLFWVFLFALSDAKCPFESITLGFRNISLSIVVLTWPKPAYHAWYFFFMCIFFLMCFFVLILLLDTL